MDKKPTDAPVPEKDVKNAKPSQTPLPKPKTDKVADVPPPVKPLTPAKPEEIKVIKTIREEQKPADDKKDVLPALVENRTSWY